LGVVTVPLTPDHQYEEFVDGLKLRINRQPKWRDSESE
jgi:hypothetical protein